MILETEMYAIVQTSGRQIQVEAGRFVDIDLVGKEPGDTLVFDQVLMIVDGKESHVGMPWVDGAKVTGKVLSHGKDAKIIVYKQRPKKGTRKKQGHRQGYTRVLINSIELKDKVLAEAKSEKKTPAKEAAPKAESTAKAKSEGAKPAAKAKAPAKQGGEKPAKKAASKKAE
jgi:large subunit ribosomal protein L21